MALFESNHRWVPLLWEFTFRKNAVTFGLDCCIDKTNTTPSVRPTIMARPQRTCSSKDLERKRSQMFITVSNDDFSVKMQSYG
jgi:hypothetical protein